MNIVTYTAAKSEFLFTNRFLFCLTYKFATETIWFHSLYAKLYKNNYIYSSNDHQHKGGYPQILIQTNKKKKLYKKYFYIVKGDFSLHQSLQICHFYIVLIMFQSWCVVHGKADPLVSFFELARHRSRQLVIGMLTSLYGVSTSCAISFFCLFF